MGCVQYGLLGSQERGERPVRIDPPGTDQWSTEDVDHEAGVGDLDGARRTQAAAGWRRMVALSDPLCSEQVTDRTRRRLCRYPRAWRRRSRYLRLVVAQQHETGSKNDDEHDARDRESGR